MNDRFIILPLIVSCLCSAIFILRILISLYKYTKKRIAIDERVKTKYISFKAKLFISSALLIFAVWSLRFAVGYYAAYNTVEGIAGLNFWEEVFNSLVHALQTISLNENYTEYITAGKSMISDLFEKNELMVETYGIYASVLNLVAPAVGAAALFEIISEFSPKVRLLLANINHFKTKYYFSNLNENSLALAKNIVSKEMHKACIVFTDYNADDDENSSEQLFKAKSIRAICLKEDLLHLSFRGRSPKILLMDTSENKNLQLLTGLIENNTKSINRSEIYIFSSDKVYSNLDESVAFIINQRIANGTDEKNIPVVIPVNGIRNMAMDLFSQVPLYEPLVCHQDPNKEKDLTVTILGSGAIGTEIFLNTYWCGQILNCRLNINVISKEKKNKESEFNGEGNFEGRIKYINPDIFETEKPNSEILKYSDKGEYSPPYFSYDYKESDVMSDDFINLMKDPKLLDTDYFIVALGSDEENLEIANRLRQIIGVHHMFSDSDKKTVISYVVYNSELCRALNKDCKYKYTVGKTEPDIYMYAFGCLEDVYSVRNVFFEGKKESAHVIAENYESQKGTLISDLPKKDNEKRFKDIYKYQASIAREFHKKYKVFSIGFQKLSVFNSDKAAEERNKEPEEEYLRFVVSLKKSDMVNGKTKMEWLHELAWLEHRRWCAFMRTKGFRNLDSKSGEDFEKYYREKLTGHKGTDHKFVPLKLHPCLVECSKKGINSEFNDYGYEIREKEFLCNTIIDYLDMFSYKRRKIDSEAEDVKRWDYPEDELSAYEKEKYEKERI